MSQLPSASKTCVCRNPRGCRIGKAGRLFVWFPVPHALAKVIAFLKSAALDYELMQRRSGLSVTCKAGQVQEVAAKLAHLLAPGELKETRVLFLPGIAEPQLQDFSDVISLRRFIGLIESDWLIEMLAAERFTTHFQPIVLAQDTSQIYAYESLLRGLDAEGSLVMPGLILEQATKADLLPQLDRVARLSAIAQASQHQLKGRIFINFIPTALYDPVSCLQSTVEAIDKAGIDHERIVFEVVETDMPRDLDHLKTVLKYYREAGFSVALDDLGAGYSSLNLLHQLRPDFIKLDMALIRNVHQDPYKASITEKLLEIAQALRVQTVAEGIESIEELHWLQERGATFAQGYLFAKPSAVPVREVPHYEAPVALKTSTALKQPSEHQHESERIVAAITQRIRQSLELDEILQATADEVRQLFNLDRVVIYQFESDWSGLVAVESLAEGCLSILGLHVTDTRFQLAHTAYYLNGDSQAIEDIETAALSACHLELLHKLNVRAVLIVPILQQERLWGLLVAHQCCCPRRWHQAEIGLFNQLASQAAIAIQQSELYHQLQQANRELQRLAASDGLTQVANRRCFDDALNAEWKRHAHEQLPLSLILCDVDCFKRYNDTQGHLAGDDTLRQIAKAIDGMIQPSAGLVARYRGEEFAVLLPNTNAQRASAIAETIQAQIKALRLPHPSSEINQFMTLSLGVTTTIPHLSASPAMLVAAAHQGLYQVKAQGRNGVVQMDWQYP